MLIEMGLSKATKWKTVIWNLWVMLLSLVIYMCLGADTNNKW